WLPTGRSRMQPWLAGTRCWQAPLWMRPRSGTSRRVRKSPPRLSNSVLIPPSRGDSALSKALDEEGWNYEYRKEAVPEFRGDSGNGPDAAGDQPVRGASRA